MDLIQQTKRLILEGFERWLTKIASENIPAAHDFDHLVDEPPRNSACDRMADERGDFGQRY